MKRKVLIISGIAAATVLAGGWALAQTVAHGPGGFGPPFMQGHGPMQQQGQMQHQGHGGMGPGMMMQHKGAMGMGRGMMQHKGMQHQGGTMGPGMMGPGMMGPGMMHGSAGQTTFDPARLTTLKTELAITPAQETAWTKYTTTVQDAATAMSTTRAGVDPNTVRNMTPADRFAFVTKIREQAQARFTAVQTAANELLAVLDDTQKTKARNILPGLAFGPGRAASVNPQQQHQH
jgi:hypothetical protein